MNGMRVLPAFWFAVGALVFLAPCTTCGSAVEASQAQAPAKPPVIRVAYFAPADREPIPGYVERIDRVMVEVQRFYREEMKAAGYGPMTFALECDAQGRLVVHVARGPGKLREYGRNASGAVAAVVREALSAKGLDPKEELVVIFENLLEWQGKKAVEIGPYCGGGGHLAGTAWVYDDKLLDPRKLGSKDPGGYYHRPCSVGEFNSHYIGGVAHEMGHAFGLPHVCQTKAERKTRGNALMGGGNHSYGNQLRGKGNGTFLSPISALFLSRNRYFAGDLPGARDKATCELKELAAAFEGGRLRISGRLAAVPPARGIAAYDDWVSRPADYDAVGWVGTMEADGRFRLEIDELRRGASQMRFRVAHANGRVSTIRIDYRVDDKGIPDVGAFNGWLVLKEAVAAFVAKDPQKLKAIAARAEKSVPASSESGRKIAHLVALLAPAPLRALADVSEAEKSVLLSSVKCVQEKVGWGRPLRDRVGDRNRPWLQVGGRFHASGLYAHAPARHVWEPGRGWKRLQGECGLQDGSTGSVVFVVRGDGRELFRSKVVKDHQARPLNLDVSSVSRLELVVEDAGDGTRSDWGVWLAPRLER
jgi:hypothetical protein